MEKLQIDRNFYATSIGALKSDLKKRDELSNRVSKLSKDIASMQSDFVRMLNAQKILSTVSDDNTRKTLEFITGMVNKVLAEMFGDEGYYIKMTPKLYQGCKPHLIVELFDSKGHSLDISVQSGDGIKQVVSFMYAICLIEIRKARRFIILDERLNGLHKSAKKCIAKIMEIFVKGGFQFMIVEYSLNDIGKIYNVERRNGESKILQVEGDYDDSLLFIGDVDTSLMTEEEE